MKFLITYLNPKEIEIARKYGRLPADTDTVVVNGTWVDVAEALGVPRETETRPFETVYFSRLVMVEAWADAAQEAVIRAAFEARLLTESSLSDEEREALIEAPVSALPWANKEWTVIVPLFVIDDYYHDEPGCEPPTGNVIHLSCRDSMEVARAAVVTRTVAIEIVDTESLETEGLPPFEDIADVGASSSQFTRTVIRAKETGEASVEFEGEGQASE